MRVTLGAEVARSYLMLRGVQAQQALVAEHRLIDTELLRLAAPCSNDPRSWRHLLYGISHRSGRRHE